MDWKWDDEANKTEESGIWFVLSEVPDELMGANKN